MSYKLSILMSATYLNNANLPVISDPRFGEVVDVLVDSGAFTNYEKFWKIKTGKSSVKNPTYVTIEHYIKIARDYLHGNVWGYISLDVLKKPEETQKNLDKMVEAGLGPIPVLVVGMGVENVIKFKEINKWICVAGGVKAGAFKVPDRIRSIRQVGGDDIKIHMLGYVRIPEIFSLPLDSADSSSWCGGGMYGRISRYDKIKGFTGIWWKEFFYPNRKDFNLIKWYSYVNNDLRVPEAMRKDKENYNRVRGIPSFSTIYAYLKFASHLDEMGKKYFFAVPNLNWLEALISVWSSIDESGLMDYKKATDTFSNFRLYRENLNSYVKKVVEMVKKGGMYIVENPETQCIEK